MIKNIGFFSQNLHFNAPYNIPYVIQKNVLIYTNHFVFYVFLKKETKRKRKKKTQSFCSKEENQRDCVVCINLNKIDEAWKKKICSKEGNQRDCVGIYNLLRHDSM